MFQKFTTQTSPATGKPRVAALREAMKAKGVHGFLVPRADAHQGENVAPRDERLAWLTGFTGSAGFAAVSEQDAVLFVDGRYTLQSRSQCDGDVFQFQSIPSDKLSDWVIDHLGEGDVFAYDPWLHGKAQIDALSEALAKAGITLTPVDNLIDAVWEDQPDPPAGEIYAQDQSLAGKSSDQKRQEIGAAIAESGAKAAVLNLPDSIAWLLNIRGSDIARTPVPLAFAIVEEGGQVALFTNPDKVGTEVETHLGQDVTVQPPEAFEAALEALKGPVLLDKTSAPVRVAQCLEGQEIIWDRDPCILPKAIKTGAELAGTRAAHLRDGAAMAEFLAWLDREAPKGNLTEIDVVRELEGFRRATNSLRDISFETISGAGANGAIVHYRVSEDSNAAVVPGSLLLVDSGGQYVDGTTDITRTISIGPVMQEAMRPFTLVLKGMISLTLARWPEGLAGRDLDALARQALWQAGLDYDHGTGHGVGVYLGVHEGPQNLSRRGVEPLQAGMILSNEPGYYREGAFGIRIENLVIVTEVEVILGGDRPMMGFETLTFAPIDRRLIDASLLSRAERDWLNGYHALVKDRLGPLVSDQTQAWLSAACAPL